MSPHISENVLARIPEIDRWDNSCFYGIQGIDSPLLARNTTNVQSPKICR